MGKCKSLSDISQSIDYRDYREEISIDSIDRKCSDSQLKQRAIADKLLQKLGEPNSWKFYAKCAYHLSEDEIWHFVELATRPQIRDKNRYFVKIASNAMN